MRIQAINTLCFISSFGMLPHERMLFAPEGETTGGTAGESSTAPDAAAKAFTQEDLDRAVTSRLSRERSAFEKKLAEATSASSEKLRTLESQLAETMAKLEDAGKTGSDKDLAAMKRDLAKAATRTDELAKERETYKTKAEQVEKQYRDHLAKNAVMGALNGAKVVAGALDDAARLLLATSKVEITEQGDVVLEYNGVTYEDMSKAAEAFLSSKPFFRAHPGGGAGTPRQSGTSGQPLNGADLSGATAAELIALDMRMKAQQAR